MEQHSKEYISRIKQIAQESMERRRQLAKRFNYYAAKIQMNADGVHHLPKDAYEEMLREEEPMRKLIRENVFAYIYSQNKGLVY